MRVFRRKSKSKSGKEVYDIMAVIRLNKKNIAKIRRMMEKRISLVKKLMAYQAARYLVEFEYHAKWTPQPWGQNIHGWTDYYAASWNIGIGSENLSFILPPRQWQGKGEPAGAFTYAWNRTANADYGWNTINSAKPGETVFVTNPVYYGSWLNNGGFLHETFLRQSRPNRFIELCRDFIDGRLDNIIKTAKEEVQL